MHEAEAGDQPAVILRNDKTAAVAISRGLRPTVTPHNQACTIKLTITSDYLSMTARFLTPFSRVPQAASLAGFSLAPAPWSRSLAYNPANNPDTSDCDAWTSIGPGCWVLLSARTTGAIIGVYQLTAAPVQEIRASHSWVELADPNFDAPPADAFRPQGLQAVQQAVVVALGFDSTSPQMGQPPTWVTVHEQYWALGGITCTLAPKERRSVGYLRETGRLDSTTDQDQIQASLNASISGSASWGWGSLSVALSASFSKSSITTHTMTMTSKEVMTVQQTLHNPADEPVSILEWQLIDRFVITPASKMPAVIECAQPGSVMRTVPSHIKPQIT